MGHVGGKVYLVLNELMLSTSTLYVDHERLAIDPSNNRLPSIVKSSKLGLELELGEDWPEVRACGKLPTVNEKLHPQ